MGQSAEASSVNYQEDLFLRELKVYQWRADSNFNIFVPRVYFKSVFAKLQQQQFTKFIQQQENSHYFQVSKFRQRIQQMPKNADEQVIVFQNYQCTLKELQGKLSFQQALYVLQALLAGYEQIKKVYQTIIIDSRCCFVTSQGSIRAWINPNSKNNRLWNEQEGETIRHNIIYKIARMVQLSTQASKRSEQFFSNLFFNLTHIQMNCSYSELRRWINEYCFTHDIIMSKKIQLNTKSNDKRKNSKKHQGHSRKTEITGSQQSYKENNPLFLSTQQSEYNHHFHRARSVQKKFAETSAFFETRNTNLPQPLREISIPSHFQLQNSSSQIFIRLKEDLSPVKISTMIQTVPQSNIVNENQLMLSRVQNLNQDKNRLQLGSSKQLEFASKQSSQSRQLKLEKDQREVKLLKKSSMIKAEKPRDQKKTMQVSIMQNIVDNRKQNRRRNYAEKEYSQKESDSQSLSYSRPWITTKTITKLISDNQEKYSLKNSIAQSSDYYNGSVYSGVLTQMGRDVPKPINLALSKTVGISQQL